MKQTTSSLVGLLCLTLMACSSEPSTDDGASLTYQPVLPAQLSEQWQLVNSLSDEFDNRDIDANKWNKDPADWGPWSWEPDNVWQQDGLLNIQIDYSEHTAKRWNKNRRKVDVDLFYTSGIIRSYGYQTYGYYEARIKGVPTFPGSSPAFWIYSLNDEVAKMGLKGTKEGEPTYSEVDIVELQQSEWIEGTYQKYDGPEVIDMNLHTRIIENGKEVWKRPGKFPELTKNKIHADFDVRDDFHVYGAEVSEDKITWYLDGKKVAEKPNLYWHLPMHVTLSLGLRFPQVSYRDCPQNLNRCQVPEAATADGYPSAMQVDWVRVYKKKP
ncbi:glycosyl hydrolase family protein [Thalassotalea litorea]|uniref:Glycosyl hydrolase family protein n=1 Tax=Thalassotalea litorea TaxID=2020715 RepID=A0A5R9IIB8_9GAMM|nr:family 16 glycosylhydrolase [Thalassotalea litorea]TLU64329.1 glycosyl hydrolase family protein [Thalassotalea litorea]